MVVHCKVWFGVERPGMVEAGFGEECNAEVWNDSVRFGTRKSPVCFGWTW